MTQKFQWKVFEQSQKTWTINIILSNRCLQNLRAFEFLNLVSCSANK